MRGMAQRIAASIVALALLAAGCGGRKATEQASPTKKRLKVAILMPGRQNDNSFNQWGAESLKRAAAEDGAVDYQILDQIPDPSKSVPAMEQFAAQGYNLIIGHGIEYVQPIHQIAARYPGVAFVTSCGTALKLKPTSNIDDWCYDFPGMGFTLGVAAAMASKSGKIGLVGGPELDFIRVVHSAFRAGAKLVNPSVRFVELFAGSFDDAERAAEAAQTEVQRGVDVLYCSGDGICEGVVKVAEEAKIPAVTGGDISAIAPDVLLAATKLDLTKLYLQFFELIRKGRWGNQSFLSTVANGEEVTTKIYPVKVQLANSIAAIQSKINQVIGQIRSGEIDIDRLASSG